MSNSFDKGFNENKDESRKGDTPQKQNRFRRASFNNGDNEGGQANLIKHFKEVFGNVAGDINELKFHVVDGKDIGRSVSENYLAVSLQIAGQLFVHPLLITSPTRQLMSMKTTSENGRDVSEMISYIETVKHGVADGESVLSDIVDHVSKDLLGASGKAVLAYYYISPTDAAKTLYSDELTAPVERLIRSILNNAQNCLAVTSNEDYTLAEVVNGASLEARFTFQPERIIELGDGTPVRGDFVATLKAVNRSMVEDITRDNASEDLLARVYSYVGARYIGRAGGDVRAPNYDNGQFMPLLNVEIDLESPDLKEGAIIERGLAALSLIPAQLSNGRWKLQYTPDTIPEDCRLSDFYYGFHPDTVEKLPSEAALDKLEKDDKLIGEFLHDRVWRDEDFVDVAITVNDHRLGSAFSQLFLDIASGEPSAQDMLINALHDRYTANGTRRPDVVKQVEGILQSLMTSEIVLASNTQLNGVVGAGSKRPSSVVDSLYVFGKLGRNYGQLIDDYIDITSFDGTSMPEREQDVRLVEIMSKITNDCFTPEGYETKVILSAQFIEALDRLNAVSGYGIANSYDYNGTIPQHNRRDSRVLSGHRAGISGPRGGSHQRSARTASSGRYNRYNQR